jgi:uncharacterized protein
MTRHVLVGIITLFASSVLGAQDVPFFATPTERGVLLRWVWGEGQRPTGYFVERRSSGSSPWTRITPRPISRIRDRAAARALLTDRFDRYEGLLFSTSPGVERSDPETFRGMLLLSADLDPDVAHVLGLRHDDATAIAGSVYEYRLIALTSAGETVAGTSDAVIAGGYRPHAGPGQLTPASGSRGAAFRWTTSARFSGYHVYRATRRDGSDARRLNGAPVIVFTRDDGSPIDASPTFFTDTAPPADTAFYHVRGIDMFGRLSTPSATVAHVYRAPVTLDAPVLVRTRTTGDTVVVNWQPSENSRATRYQLWRGDSVTGTFVRVGPPVRAAAREQRDAGRPTRRVLWYRVTALDDAGRESDPSTLAIAEIPDRAPPPVPDSVVAAADTGRMSLRWRHVAASDLRGYRVYRAFEANGTFALLSPLPRRDARFVDSIPRRADHAYYYRVTAVDSAYNESAPSAVIVIRPPDATPPSAPRLGQVRHLDGSLEITWIANPEPDVVGYRPRYRVKGQGAWRDVASTLPPTQLSDTIAALLPGSVYEVTVVAIDDAGNVSMPAPSVTATAVRKRQLERPDLRRAVFEASARGVVITWSVVSEVRGILVLRRDLANGQALRLVGDAPAGTTRFIDRTTRPGNRYEYVVRARDAFGNESESRARSVEIPQTGTGRGRGS